MSHPALNFSTASDVLSHIASRKELAASSPPAAGKNANPSALRKIAERDCAPTNRLT
jgi:hypothetical protein